ncbi:UvrD-helicase domain-containing protein [Dyadobacter jiangsuensis]
MSVITSDTRLPDIESHFKVLAGPGAGKTRFLVNHIKNILTNSDRLGIQRKIACITYTNIAAETILSRIGDHAERVEINTIHSFLYKYVVKPYVHFIADEHGLDALSIKGHDDVLFTNYSFIKEWKRRTAQNYITDDRIIISAWEKLRWDFDESGALVISTPYPIKAGRLQLKKVGYLTYKQMTWEKGLLHHDDVLFFSYKLVTEKPFILDVLRACFPYFLVDEFQDTSPIQLAILKLIAQKETVLGVVGDEAQSIYGFLGAKPGQLGNFKLPDILEFKIEDNWRSSNQIVALLNSLRSDLRQEPLRKHSSTNVTLVVGDKLKALEWVSKKHPGEQIVTLSRDNITANSISKGIGMSGQKDLLAELKQIDGGNKVRRQTISNIIKGIEYARLGYFKDAMKTIGRLHNGNGTEREKKKSLKVLKLALSKESEFADKNIIDLFNFINREGIAALTPFKAGAPKTFYENTPVKHLAAAVRNLYEAGNHRTIHKAKGDEFNLVMMTFDLDKDGKFEDSKALEFITKPDLARNEDHRVGYVALSRAQNHLVISVPSLSTAIKAKLESLDISVEVLL